MGRPKGQPLPEDHRKKISKSLRNSAKAHDYHQNRQRGKKREPFTIEWRARMSVSRRLKGVPKDSPEYEAELKLTIERMRQQERKQAQKEDKDDVEELW